MAQDLGNVLGGLVDNVLRGGDPVRAGERILRREAQRTARDALTPDTVQSELAEERQEQRRNRNNTLTENEMQGLLRIAERTNTTLDIQPQQDGTYRFAINGERPTQAFRVDDEAIALAQQSAMVNIAHRVDTQRTAPQEPMQLKRESTELPTEPENSASKNPLGMSYPITVEPIYLRGARDDLLPAGKTAHEPNYDKISDASGKTYYVSTTQMESYPPKQMVYEMGADGDLRPMGSYVYHNLISPTPYSSLIDRDIKLTEPLSLGHVASSPTRATDGVADTIGLLATDVTARDINTPQERQEYAQALQNLVQADGKITVASNYNERMNNALIDIAAGQYTATQLGLLIAREAGMSRENLTALEQDLRTRFNEPAPAPAQAPAKEVPTVTAPDVTTQKPRLEVDPAVFTGDTRVTGGDVNPVSPRSAGDVAAGLPPAAAPASAPAAPALQEPAVFVQAAVAPSMAPAPQNPTVDAPVAAPYTQEQLMEIGKEVSAAVKGGGKNAQAIEAMLGKNANGDGQLSEKEATAALNTMQALNFSPEGRAQLAELARALQGQGVSGGDTIAGGENRSPNAGVGTQIAQRSGGIDFA